VPVRWVRGNADRLVVEHFDRGDTDPSVHGPDDPAARADSFTAGRIARSHRDALAGFEEVVTLDGVLYCHGSPRSDEEMITAATPEERLRAMLVGVRQRVVVCGHTHMQFDRTVDGMRIVNAGSVGMPYGDAGAYWLLLGPEIMLRRTLYDLEDAAARIRASGYPQARDFAENNVLKPETEAEAIAVFESIAQQRAHDS
jgi:predicted phosphodiesterase